MKSIYLAGPIGSLTYGDAVNWRDEAMRKLEFFGIEGFSPMHGKDYLKSETAIKSTSGYIQPLSTPQGIMARDFQDATKCDRILANLSIPHAKPSLGTVMELAWAYRSRTPVIAIDSPLHRYKEHPMISQAVPFWATHLDEAIELARIILLNK